MATSENVASTYGFTMTADEIIRRALQMIGNLDLDGDPDASQYSFGRDAINLTLKALQNKGIRLSSLSRASQALTSGVASYALAADVIDIDEPHMLLLTDGETEVPLLNLSRDDYMQISTKADEGQPTAVYIEKTRSTLTAYFWPVPNDSFTWKHAKVKLLRNIDDGSQTPDLAARWLKALLEGVAVMFAEHYGKADTTIARLERRAMRDENDAINADTERGDMQFIF